MKYLRQIYYEMKHQKMMTWVSISGTALSIFLVMVFFMVENVNNVELAPETNRNRIYSGHYIDLFDKELKNESSGLLAYDIAKRLYGDLEGVENVTYMSAIPFVADIFKPGVAPSAKIGLRGDGNYWNFYDFKFIDGKPFDEGDCLSNAKKVVISQSLARHIYGRDDVAGETLNIDAREYTVCGVVKDVNRLLKNTGADFYLPLDSKSRDGRGGDRFYWQFFGDVKIQLLLAQNADINKIRAQVKERYGKWNSEIRKNNIEVVYRNTPYDNETMQWEDLCGNNTPDLTTKHRKRWLIYCLLVLLPAINLGGIMKGRLNRRVSEIGVRRAFGASRFLIVSQLLWENLILTFIGGIIGLLLSLLFVRIFSSEFFNMIDIWGASLDVLMATPSFDMLFTWNTFFIALGGCLLLNILSATLPAWRSAKMEPATAISKSRI